MPGYSPVGPASYAAGPAQFGGPVASTYGRVDDPFAAAYSPPNSGTAQGASGTQSSFHSNASRQQQPMGSQPHAAAGVQGNTPITQQPAAAAGGAPLNSAAAPAGNQPGGGISSTIITLE
jgi:hypothetical protein